MAERKLRLLIDTNIFLELLLGRDKGVECREFLRKSREKYELFTTIFSVHSIGIILYKYGKIKHYKNFINFLKQYKIKIYVPSIEEEAEIVDSIESDKLDFDDAFQYISAKKLGVDYIVSFDKDFDSLSIKRLKPENLL